MQVLERVAGTDAIRVAREIRERAVELAEGCAVPLCRATAAKRHEVHARRRSCAMGRRPHGRVRGRCDREGHDTQADQTQARQRDVLHGRPRNAIPRAYDGTRSAYCPRILARALRARRCICHIAPCECFEVRVRRWNSAYIPIPIQTTFMAAEGRAPFQPLFTTNPAAPRMFMR